MATFSRQLALPHLREVAVTSLDPDDKPVLKIKTDEDIELWKQSRGYQDYGLFLRRLAESVVGCTLPYNDPNPDQGVTAVVDILGTLDRWIDEIPPLPTPQRFGNLAFRTWGKRLELESSALLEGLLPPALHAAIPFIEPYLLTSFGSFTRMDYGTGHETSFALFLLCLTFIRFLAPEPLVERQVVLNLFERYLRLCWRLQDVYKLEPAGSHGVWGLDDYFFLSYIFGSAQLRDQKQIAVSAVLHPPLPQTNLYFMSIMRIHEVKSGPFHEHSSQLYSIASGVQYWAKVHSGLFKMYEAEVLGKRVVVQHIPLGGLLEWGMLEQQQKTVMETPALFASPVAPAPPSTTSNRFATARPMPYVSPSRDSTAHFLSGATYSPHATASSRIGYRQAGAVVNPIVPGRMLLGPTASTAMRSSALPGSTAQSRDPPTANHPSTSGDAPGSAGS